MYHVECVWICMQLSLVNEIHVMLCLKKCVFDSVLGTHFMQALTVLFFFTKDYLSKQNTLRVNIIIVCGYFSFCKMFFTIKLLTLVNLITQDKPICSYIRLDYPLFTLYFALYTVRVPSLTEEIRAARDFKLCLRGSKMKHQQLLVLVY